MKRLAPAACTLALIAAASAGCPDTSTLLCPASTTPAGNFSLTLTFDSTQAGECHLLTQLPDGGLIDDGGTLGVSVGAQDSSLCTSPADGGGPVLYLALAGSVRSGSLDGSAFAFATSTQIDSTNSPCGCTLQVDEAIAGTLTTAAAGGTINYSADGGLPALGNFTGTVVDQVALVPDGGKCLCNLPCQLPFTMTGSKQ